MHRQIRGLGLACGAALALTGSANAQVIPMSFTEIVEAADTIVEAETGLANVLTQIHGGGIPPVCAT